MNLLWIMTDQQPVDTIGTYGNPRVQTPAIDRIAAEGVRFDRCYAAAFPCSPARASLMTGRYPHRHGVTANDVVLDASVPALGDCLRESGYTTAHFGKWHLGGNMYHDYWGANPHHGRWHYQHANTEDGFAYDQVPGGDGEDAPQHGFDHWVGGWAQYRAWLRGQGMGAAVDSTIVGGHNVLQSGDDDTHAVSDLGPDRHVEAFLADHAARFLDEQRGADAPFAAVVSFYAPHLPVAPPRPWDGLIPLEQVPLPENYHDTLEQKPLRQQQCEWHKLGRWTDLQFRDYIQRYWGYCSFVDVQVSKLLEALERNGQADDTLVLFTSDHGDMIGGHGFIYKMGGCGYDELFRVPLVMRCPGKLAADMTFDQLFSSIDLLPTVCELLDIEPPEVLDGRSAYPTLRDPGATHRETAVCTSMEETMVVLAGEWKYVLHFDPSDRDELYNLAADPGELLNRAPDPGMREQVTSMRKHICDWIDETNYPYPKNILTSMEM
jgi:arylsulfatase A-like enzyme